MADSRAAWRPYSAPCSAFCVVFAAVVLSPPSLIASVSCFAKEAAHVDVVDYLKLQTLQALAKRGDGVRVATFDTGVATKHAAFSADASTPLTPKIVVCRAATDQPTCEDGFGHGTFVAGLIAGSSEAAPIIDGGCRGIASGASLYVFKVFTDKQATLTSWFVAAFNEALAAGVDVINLSIGGPDSLDAPFSALVQDLVSSGAVIVAAVGNDGPKFGSVLNPADLANVIAVGAAGPWRGKGTPTNIAEGGGAFHDAAVAPFSSRGMTTAEIPWGMGQARPDIVTVGVNLLGPKHSTVGGCKILSGTSVAAPVVTGTVVLVAAVLKRHGLSADVATVKKLLLTTAVPLQRNCDGAVAGVESHCGPEGIASTLVVTGGSGRWPPAGDMVSDAVSYRATAFDEALEASYFVQGAGRMDVGRITAALTGNLSLRGDKRAALLHPYLFPSEIDFLPASCPRHWPHCDTPLFHAQRPVSVNVSLLTPQRVLTRITHALWTEEAVGGDGGPNQTASTLQVSLQVRDVVATVAHLGDGIAAVDFPLLGPYVSPVGIILVVTRDVPRPVEVRGRLKVCIRSVLNTPDDGDDDNSPLQGGDTSPVPSASRCTRLLIKALVVPRPPRHRRVLWDLSRQLLYPPYFVPRDNLAEEGTLDWLGDHPFTNLRHAFNMLRRADFHVDLCSDGREFQGEEVQAIEPHDESESADGAVIRHHYTLDHYGVLLIIDPEEFWLPNELSVIELAVKRETDPLSLVVFSEWYDRKVQDSLAYTDDGTKEWWTAITGGANVPALNDLLGRFGVLLSGRVFDGTAEWGGGSDERIHRSTVVASGGSLAVVPADGSATWCAPRLPMHDVSMAHRGGRAPKTDLVPLVALVDATCATGTCGRLAVFTDSHCLDAGTAHRGNNPDATYCPALFLSLMHFAADGWKGRAARQQGTELTSARCFTGEVIPNVWPEPPPRVTDDGVIEATGAASAVVRANFQASMLFAQGGFRRVARPNEHPSRVVGRLLPAGFDEVLPQAKLPSDAAAHASPVCRLAAAVVRPERDGSAAAKHGLYDEARRRAANAAYTAVSPMPNRVARLIRRSAGATALTAAALCALVAYLVVTGLRSCRRRRPPDGPPATFRSSLRWASRSRKVADVASV